VVVVAPEYPRECLSVSISALFSPGEFINSKEDIVQVLIEGQAIKHELYGMGVVMESNSERTTIDFEDYGSKKFVTSIWVAELIGEAPEHPVKPRRGGRRKKAVAKAAKA
jgi:hypothetical protein